MTELETVVLFVLTIVIAPRGTTLPIAPPKVTEPAVPALKVRFWTPDVVASIVDVDPEKVMFAPVADPPLFVVSKVTEASKRVLPVRVIELPLVVTFAPKELENEPLLELTL